MQASNGELRRSPTSVPDREPNPPKAKRQIIANACERCRRLKAKCDGRRPCCSRCEKTGQRNCAYAAAVDETRTAALRRNLQDVEHRNTEYEELHGYLLSKSESEAIEILRRLRTSQDLSATLSYIKEGDLLIQAFPHASNLYNVNISAARSPLQLELATVYPHVYMLDLSSLYSEEDSRTASHSNQANHLNPAAGLQQFRNEGEAVTSRVQGIDFSHYPDVRIAQAKCSPWTTLIKDDELFRRLLSLYFAWQHDHYHQFDKDSFLNDLVHQGSTYCAPMLVNAVLAFSHIHFKVLIQPNGYRVDPTLGLAFLREARRLWESQTGVQTLVELQTTTLLGLTYSSVGKDKVGGSFQTGAFRILENMGIADTVQAQDQDNTLFRAQKQTAWGIFLQLRFLCVAIRRPCLFEMAPKGPFPQDIGLPLGSKQEQTWAPYPYIGPLIAFDSSATKIAAYKLWTIAANIQSCLFGGSARSKDWPSLAVADDLYNQLLSWCSSMPYSLRPQRHSHPSILILHTYFHTLTIELFRPFVEPPSSVGLQSLDSSSSHAKSLTTESMRQLKILNVLIITQYDYRLVPLSFINSLLLVCFDIKSSLLQSHEDAAVFVLCYRTLEEYSHICPITAPMCKLLKDLILGAAKTAERAMPESVRKVLRLDEGDGRNTRLENGFGDLQSDYLIDIDNVNKEMEATRIESLVTKWSVAAEMHPVAA